MGPLTTWPGAVSDSVNGMVNLAQPTAPAGIRLSGLTKSYGHVPAVRGIDVAIAPGETTALLGPNGAGKSTTIDMVLGLARPDQGSVSLFGMSPTQAVHAGAVGAMLQSGSLIEHLSVRELVTMVASLYPHPLDVDDVLRRTGTAAFAGRPTTKLSGGQTQRVRFAVALVADPDLLVLDEPTAGLDVEGRRDFWTVIREAAAGGKTILFATHYLEEADAYADRIILMAEGRIIADGPGTEIKARVGARTIRATLPGADLAALSALAGVASAERHGDMIILTGNDSDAVLLELIRRYPQVRDIEVRGAALEDAFLELTADAETDNRPQSDHGARAGHEAEEARR
jgi:ABC-2 type transport system ATP-binding protein